MADEVRGASLRVQLVAGLDAPLYLDVLADLDFEDMYEGLGAFAYIVVSELVGGMSPGRAREIAEAIHKDLNYGDEVETWWVQEGDEVVLGIAEILEPPDGAELMTG